MCKFKTHGKTSDISQKNLGIRVVQDLTLVGKTIEYFLTIIFIQSDCKDLYCLNGYMGVEPCANFSALKNDKTMKPGNIDLYISTDGLLALI